VKYTSLVENVYPLIQTFIRNKNCHYAPGVLAAIVLEVSVFQEALRVQNLVMKYKKPTIAQK
jgi:hypothetical protein